MTRRLAAALWLALAAAFVLAGSPASGAAARAASCLTIPGGPPGSPAVIGPGTAGRQDVCIPVGWVVVTETRNGKNGAVRWHSLTLGDASHDDAHLILGDHMACAAKPDPAVVDLAASSAILAGATLTLSSSSSCVSGGDSSVHVAKGATLANAGTIETVSSNGAGQRLLQGSVLNTNALSAHLPTRLRGPGTFTNQGNVTDDPGQLLQVDAASPGNGLTFANTSGSVLVNGGLLVNAGNAFTEGDGPVVGATRLVGATLSYAGSGSSQLSVEGPTKLSGDLAAAQTLDLTGGGAPCTGVQAVVTVAGGFTNAGTIATIGCSSAPPSLTLSSGTLANTGSIGVQVGLTLKGNVDNTGDVELVGNSTTLSYTGGTFTNAGSLRIASATFSVAPGAGASFVSAAGGSVANNGGSFLLGAGNTFTQGAGPVAGTIVLDGGTLKYAGAGASHIAVQGTTKLIGDIAAGQTLELQGSGASCPWPQAAVTAAKGFANAGTILTAQCNSAPSLTVSAGTLLNKGSLQISSGLTLQGSLKNTGSVEVTSGSTLTYDSGLLTNAGAFTVDAGSSFAAPGDAGIAFVNSSGSLVNNGSFRLDYGNAFTQGNGKASGNSLALVAGSLQYTGTGASHIAVSGTTALSGNIAATQTLELVASCVNPQTSVSVENPHLTNAGTILSTGCNSDPELTAGQLTNTGTIETAAGLDIHASVANQGTIRSDVNSRTWIETLDNYVSGAHILMDGTYVVGVAGSIVVPGLDLHTNAATISLQGGMLTDGASDALRHLTQNQGSLAVADPTGSAAYLIPGSLTDSGTLTVGPGALTVGAYTQTSSGILDVLVTDSGHAGGQLRAEGAATFAGALRITRAAGYAPASGDSRQLVTYSSSSGEFGLVEGAAAGHGLSFVLEYDPGAATIHALPTAIRLTPRSGSPGSQFVVTGSHFSPGETVSITFGSTAATPGNADANGSFSQGETVPSVAKGSVRARHTTT